MAGEEAGEAPSDTTEGQNRAEEGVHGLQPTPHTHHKHDGGREDRRLFIAVSEKAGARAKRGLAEGGVLEREKHEKANNSPYTALLA